MVLDINDSLITTLIIVFSAGFVSGFSPCTLPTVVFLTSYVSKSKQKSALTGFYLSLWFIMGIVTLLTLLGVFAGLAGQLFSNLALLYYIMAGILIIMGLWLVKAYEVKTFDNPILDKLRPKKGSGFLGSYSFGLLFGISASPCTLPITISVLAFSAMLQSPYLGALLLFAYSLGRSIPLLIVGTFTTVLTKLSKLSKHQAKLELFSGTLLILLAFYLIWIA